MVVPPIVAVLATSFTLSQIFNYGGTFCGPAPREVVLADQLAEAMLFRIAALLVACAGVTCVAFVIPFTRAHLPRRIRWATTAAAVALALSFANAALGADVVRRLLLRLIESAPGTEASLVLDGIAHWHEFVSASNALLLGAVFLALGALLHSLVRGESLQGVAMLVALSATGIGVRGAEGTNDLVLNHWFNEVSLFRLETRVIDQDNFPWLDFRILPRWGAIPDELANSLKYARRREDKPGFGPPRHPARASFEAASLARPIGVELPSETPVEDLRGTLWVARHEGVSDLALFTPVPPLEGPPAFRAALDFLRAVHSGDALSVRFDDEVACVATTDWARPLVVPRGTQQRVSAWDLPCETVSLAEVSVSNLHELAADAIEHGRRLVVVVPRETEAHTSPRAK
jgi:hypothetical protein